MQEQVPQPNTGQQASQRKVSWLKIVLFMVAGLVIIILGVFLIQNSTSSSATFIGAVFVVLGAINNLLQLIPIISPSPTTNIKHVQQPANTNQNPQNPLLPAPPTPPTPILTPNETNTSAPTHTPMAPQPTSFSMEPVFYPNIHHLPKIEELYGRKREGMQLLDHTRRGISTSIVGSRRIGKTWLLDYLKLMAPRELGNSFRIASWGGTTTKDKTVSTFVTQVLTDFGISLIGAPNNLGLDALTQVVENMQEKKEKVTPVLCIDVFEGLLNKQGFDCEFFEGLRHIAEQGLVLVIVSEQPLAALIDEHCKTSTSPLYNIFSQIRLKPFTKEEAEEFAKAKRDQASFNNHEFTMLLKYGQDINKQEWPPLLLQLTGNMLLRDKMLAAQGYSELYHLENKDYWDEFQQGLRETYRRAVR